MIIIVGKGYKFLLVQLSDFLEIAKTIVVSLKSVEGKKKYEKIFGRKLEDKKDNPRVRIIHINQSLLIDFVSNLFEKSTSQPLSMIISFPKVLVLKLYSRVLIKRTKKKQKTVDVA